MLTRGWWKNRQKLDYGLPPGHRGECQCGALIVLEVRGQEGFVFHHTLPWCEAFTEFVRRQKPDFSVLSAAPEEHVDAELAALRADPSSVRR